MNCEGRGYVFLTVFFIIGVDGIGDVFVKIGIEVAEGYKMAGCIFVVRVVFRFRMVWRIEIMYF